MASWTNQSTSSLLPGEPWTSAKALAAFENPEAIAEGASGAPRLLGEAAATNDEVTVLTVSAANTYSIDKAMNTSVGTLQNTSTSPVNAYTFTIVAVTGTVRARAAHRTNNAQVTMRLKKNGSVVASWSTTSAINVERTSDVSVVPGDVLLFEHEVDGVSTTSYVSNGDVTASNGYENKSLLIKSSDA